MSIQTVNEHWQISFQIVYRNIHASIQILLQEMFIKNVYRQNKKRYWAIKKELFNSKEYG